MTHIDWRLRLKVLLQRFWQPTCACLTCMTAPTFANLWSVPHWLVALKTGLGTGVLALLLTFTPVGRLFAHRIGNAALVGVLTALADAWSHPGRSDYALGEPLVTGFTSFVLALAGSYVVEGGARQLRRLAAWWRNRRP